MTKLPIALPQQWEIEPSARCGDTQIHIQGQDSTTEMIPLLQISTIVLAYKFLVTQIQASRVKQPLMETVQEHENPYDKPLRNFLPDSYLEWYQNIVQRANRLKRDRGEKTFPEDHKFGFTYPQLRAEGALDIPPQTPLLSSLHNPVHPLFHINQFTNASQNYFHNIYWQIYPAFQLATLFLQNRACGRFWSIIMHGDVEDCVCELSKPKKSHKIIRERGFPNWYPDHQVHWNSALTALAEKEDFGLVFQHSHQGRVDWWGHGPEDSNRILLQEDFLRGAMRIHNMLMCGTEKKQQEAQAMNYRLVFFLAVILTHEVIHLVSRNWHTSEPYVEFGSKHFECDLGDAWEIHLFGGKVRPISAFADTRAGLFTECTTSSPQKKLPAGDDAAIEEASKQPFAQIWAVPMYYILSVQTHNSWFTGHAMAKCDKASFFKIPREPGLRQDALNCLQVEVDLPAPNQPQAASTAKGKRQLAEEAGESSSHASRSKTAAKRKSGRAASTASS